MFNWNSKNFGDALGTIGLPDFESTRIVTDSRIVQPGDIFIALKGENFNGNDFAHAAIEKGAVLAVVDDWDIRGERIANVGDGLEALHRVARWRRQRSTAKFIAVTGSVGKTSAKEMISAVLATKYKTYKNEGNFNNHIGMPLTLANMPDGMDYVVLEMGMNHAGEITQLVRIAHPHIAVITWVGEAHIQNFHSKEGIAEAKAEIFDYMAEPATAIIPGDNEFVEMLVKKAARADIHDIKLFGIKANSVVKQHSGMHANIAGADINAIIPHELLETHIIGNVLLTLSVAATCKVKMNDAFTALAGLKPQKGRGAKIKLANGVTIIDDSYNASPTSMVNALRRFQNERAPRKIAVLGDMRELGEHAKDYHEQLALFLSGVDLLLTTGDNMKFLHEKVKNQREAKHFASTDDLLLHLRNDIKEADLILMKGSHGSNIWKVVDSLMNS